MDVPANKRDLFEIENARNLTRDELIATFVPTPHFERLLASKNHVVLGSRGSGKTALVRALSHDHLCRLNHPRAKALIAGRLLIGIYIPSRLEWVGALKNKPWLTPLQIDQLFEWRLNLASCEALVATLRSCCEFYFRDLGKQTRIERSLVKELQLAWELGDLGSVDTLVHLGRILERVDYSHQQALARQRALALTGLPTFSEGQVFHADLFAPLRRALSLSQEQLDMPTDCRWAVCIDEAEFLDEAQHQALNSHMRVSAGT